MEELTQKQVDKELFEANLRSERAHDGQLLIDDLDDILFHAIIEMAGKAGYSVKAKDDFTNEFLMETRNEIMGNLVENFRLERKG